MTVAVLVLLLGLAVGTSPAASSDYGDLPFLFVLDPVDVERHRHPGTLQASASPNSLELRFDDPAPSSRIDVFESASRSLPRWKWIQGWMVAGDSALVTGSSGVETLIVIRRPGSSEYSLDGPFRWSDKPGRHLVAATRFRALRGSDRAAGAGARFYLHGHGSSNTALCEGDDQSRWQCLAVPSGFAGVVALCASAGFSGFGDVPPVGSDVTLQHPAWASAVVLDPTGPADGEARSFDIKLLKPGSARGQLWEADPTLGIRALGGNLFWLYGSAPVAEKVISVRASSHRSARVLLTTLLASRQCGEPTEVFLEADQRMFGTVYDSDGKVLPRPTVFAMEEAEPVGAPAGSGKPPRLHSSVEGDENGQYEFSELGTRTYLVRACHGSLGCSETRAAAGPRPVDFRLEGRGVFKGRLLSPTGVPEPGATVRVLPTLSQYEKAKEPFKYVPLETRSGADGRFQIAAPTTGRFLLEARSHETGTARREVEVTEQSSPTDLGDILLPRLVEFSAEVPGCSGGTLDLIGPVLGPTSLPNMLSFPVEQARAIVRLPDGGTWLAGATCSGVKRSVEPAMLFRAEELTGLDIKFKLVESAEVDPKS